MSQNHRIIRADVCDPARTMAGVKNGSRASRERRINGKHTHEASRGN
jgi:hypothetical protein